MLLPIVIVVVKFIFDARNVNKMYEVYMLEHGIIIVECIHFHYPIPL